MRIVAAGQGDVADAVRVQLSVRSLFDQHYRRLVSLARLLTGSNEVAEDIVQDCFAGLIRRGLAVADPEAYLRTSVVNGTRSWHRRQRFERALHRRRVPEDEPPDLHQVRVALDRLPLRERTALVLRFYDDLPEAEIATVLGCPLGTVKSLISRGIGHLRQEVSHE
jgi:RNA polymerase sigma factor (sigma-70 family)